MKKLCVDSCDHREGMLGLHQPMGLLWIQSDVNRVGANGGINQNPPKYLVLEVNPKNPPN